MLFHATDISLYATSCNWHFVSYTKNSCSSNPCRNGSTCVAKRDDDDYKCTCTPGFKGKNSRKAIDIQMLSRSQRITITTNLEFSERFDEEQTFKLSALEILYGDKFTSFYIKTRRIIFATYTQI